MSVQKFSFGKSEEKKVHALIHVVIMSASDLDWQIHIRMNVMYQLVPS